MKKGFSLVECMLAGSITCLMVLVLFEGIIVAGKIAHENSQFLAASDYAFDLAWVKMNEAVDKLKEHSNTTVSANLTKDAAPTLYYENSPAVSYVRFEQDEAQDGVWITANVEWGPVGKRRRLNTSSGSNSNVPNCHHELKFFRSYMQERGVQMNKDDDSGTGEGGQS